MMIINDDETIDVYGEINLASQNLQKLLLKFRNVAGSFVCSNNLLTNLEGCPSYVGGNFYCSTNILASLEDCPRSVGGNFFCRENRFTSLIGCPKSVVWFRCNDNEIDTFEGLDFVNMQHFICDRNPIFNICDKFKDHTKFEFFNYCDIIREGRAIILDRFNFFLDYIGKPTVTYVEGYKCIS